MSVLKSFENIWQPQFRSGYAEVLASIERLIRTLGKTSIKFSKPQLRPSTMWMRYIENCSV